LEYDWIFNFRTEQQAVGVRSQACPSATENEYHPKKVHVAFVASYEHMANQRHFNSNLYILPELAQDFSQIPF